MSDNNLKYFGIFNKKNKNENSKSKNIVENDQQMASSTQNSHSDYQPPVIDININVNVAKLNNDGADLGDLLTGPSCPVLKVDIYKYYI